MSNNLNIDFGRYKLIRMIGEGGMAQVYHAVMAGPMGFEKDCAIKVLKPGVDEGDRLVKALINEARLGGYLRHPNIVATLQVGDAPAEQGLAKHEARVDRFSEAYRVGQPRPSQQRREDLACGLLLVREAYEVARAFDGEKVVERLGVANRGREDAELHVLQSCWLQPAESLDAVARGRDGDRHVQSHGRWGRRA